tara:strand:+ start:242 stop:493 length:252 start_codon:yes stop_codon:yes gene_type:complete
MRFAGQQMRYRAPGYGNRDYRAPSGRDGGYRPQSGSAGMSAAMTEYQAPSAQQIAVTEMPAVNEPAYNLRSFANPVFKAPGRI